MRSTKNSFSSPKVSITSVRLDHRRTVVGVHDLVADLERHLHSSNHRPGSREIHTSRGHGTAAEPDRSGGAPGYCRPMVEALTDRQLRVLGSLAEKAATVPDTYPMTLRGLQTACNQRNSREPVTDHDEHTVLVTLDELKALGLVRFVYASHGARTTKYRHVLDEQLGLEPAELALLTVLMLRGPQTVNELRTRTERAHRFEDNEEVVRTLDALAGREEPLVVHLARQPGQKETRWAHLLGGPPADPVAEPVERPEGEAAMDAGTPSPPPAVPTVDADRAGLEARVAELEERVAALEALLTAPAPSTPDRENPPT